MIIYRKNQPPLLSDYGILIPMLKGRAEKVYEEIKSKFGEKVFSTDIGETLTEDDFLRVHSTEFINKCDKNPSAVIEQTFELVNPDGSYHRYDPASAKKEISQLVSLYKDSCDASYSCVTEAYKKGFAYYLGGGFHHSLATQGRGFCLFNDIMIAAKKFQNDVSNGLIWIIDIDAHKGCGTAAIAEKDDSVLTLSIHMKKGWPLDSGEFDAQGSRYPWFIPSSVDIEIDSGEEGSYIERLQNGLDELEKKSIQKPTLCIIVDGSDPYVEDALPSAELLKLSKAECLSRNTLVYKFLKDRKIPQAYLMAGGYGDKNWVIHYQFIEKVLNELI